MADSKLSALTATTTLVNADEAYVNDGGVSKKVTLETLSDTFNDISLKLFGAIGDGVTDDSVAIAAAESASEQNIYVPDGEYLTSATLSSLTKNYSGPGRITTTDSGSPHKRGNTIIRRATAPASVANGSSVIDGFDEEFIAKDVRDILVSGTTTVGDPVNGDGYIIQDQTCGQFEFSSFSSGKNTNVYNNADRTGWFGDRRRMTHAGKGDGWAAAWNITVTTPDTSIVGIQGVPAGGQLGGDTNAAADDLIIQNLEFNLKDNGYDCLGKGLVINCKRDNDDEAKDQFWTGSRLQSTGTKKPNSAYQAVGSWGNGLDLAQGEFDRGVVMKDGQGVFFDGVADWILPVPQWVTSEVISVVVYRYNAQKIYVSASTGTTGATPPTHVSGTVSDGGVDWTYVTTNSFPGTTTTTGGTKILAESGILNTYQGGVVATAISDNIVHVPNRVITSENIKTSVRSETGSVALDFLDSVVLIDATGPTSPTYTLASAGAHSGFAGRITFKRTGAGGTVTIQRGTTDTIVDKSGSSVTSFTLAANEATELVSDGTSVWHILYIA